MKRIVALLIACLYLAVSSGLAVQIHHCMGEIAGVTLVSLNKDVPSAKSKCGSCGMEQGANKCCKDELKFVKLPVSYKLANAGYKISLPETSLPDSNHYLANHLLLSQFRPKEYKSHSPPGSPAVPLCIMNCVFRI